jgi:hypothetical protein
MQALCRLEVFTLKAEKPGPAPEFYLELAIRVLRDSAALCNLRPSAICKDVESMQKRFSVEGLDFLTKVLPSLGKCLDKALGSDMPFQTPSTFKRSKKTGLPVFLGEFWKCIFGRDGKVLEYGVDENQQCIAAVRAIRQICFLLYKLEGCCDAQASKDVIDTFISVDRSLPDEEDEVPLSPKAIRALDNARVLLHFVLKDLDPLDIVPGHGPGAVATGEKCWEKMIFRRFYPKLDAKYSYPDYFFFNYGHLLDDMDILENMQTLHESTAKVVLVPKDSRGPRLISMEPLELQWIQQGLMRSMVREIESPHKPSFGFVNFTDQTVNRRLALENSYNGKFGTYDMKEASDRVSMWLVRKLFGYGSIGESLMAVRSDFTQLPDGHRIRLKKYAPMGSAVCFPVEALAFWSLAVGSVRDIVSEKSLRDLPEIYVYGDDIIACDSDYRMFSPIFKELFLEFNEDKCCTGRFFRESCGMDAFMAEDVTPTRIKTAIENASPSASLSHCAYINALWGKGYRSTGDLLATALEQKLGPIPRTTNCESLQLALVDPELDAQQVRTYLVSTFKVRYNKHLQRDEVRVRVPVALDISRDVPGWLELLRLHASIGMEEKRLVPGRHTVPHRIKMRWLWMDLNSLST